MSLCYIINLLRRCYGLKRRVFIRNMLRYWYMPVCGMLLLSLLNFAVVRGNEVISVVIDQMLAGETIKFGSFLMEFTILTLVGFVAAFVASAVSAKYGVLVSTRYLPTRPSMQTATSTVSRKEVSTT